VRTFHPVLSNTRSVLSCLTLSTSDEAKKHGLKPDAITYASAMRACAKHRHVLKLGKEMRANQVMPNTGTNMLIKMAKRGRAWWKVKGQRR